MNAPLPARPARVRAETLKQKKKAAREASLARRVALDAAITAALRRGRASFVDRLGAAVSSGSFDSDFIAWQPVGWALGRLPPAKQPGAVAFVAAIERASPGLCLVPTGRRSVLGDAVVHMAAIDDRLLRSVTSWRPRSRSQVRRWDELVAWTCCAFPQPALLESAFLQGNLDDEERAVAPFVGLGGSWRDAGLPTTITRAAAHVLSTSRERNGRLTAAIRQAQSQSVGVTSAHRRVIASGMLSWSLQPEREDLWLDLFGWLARNPGVAVDDVAAILTALYAVALPFSLRGRTAASFSAWAHEQARQQTLREKGRIDVGPLPLIAVDGGDYVLLREAAADARRFSIAQILDGAALVDEGLAMRHCVGTYADDAKEGATGIFSLRVARDGEVPRRALTIEVAAATRTVAQVRGKANRPADADERAVVACWARERGLTIDACAL